MESIDKDSQKARDERRFVQIKLDPWTLATTLTQGHAFEVKERGLPVGVEVVNSRIEEGGYSGSVFVMVLAHPSFAPLLEGAPIPVLDPAVLHLRAI